MRRKTQKLSLVSQNSIVFLILCVCNGYQYVNYVVDILFLWYD